MASTFPRDIVRKANAPLVGVYELKHADAHLPSKELDNAFSLLEIDRSQEFIKQGFTMLHIVVSSIYSIAEALKRLT